MSRDGVFSCKTCFSFFERLVLWFCWLLRAIRLLFMYKDGFVSLKDELVMVGAWLPLGEGGLGSDNYGADRDWHGGNVIPVEACIEENSNGSHAQPEYNLELGDRKCF